MLLAISLLASLVSALACDPVYSPKVEFDPEVYVFEGTVTGFVTDSLTYSGGLLPVPGQSEPERAGGILVRPARSTHTPQEAETYAVFPAGLGPMCEAVYWTEQDLVDRFEIGEQVYVVGREGGYRALPAEAHGVLAGGHYGYFITRASLLDGIGVPRGPWPTPLASPRREPPDVAKIRERIQWTLSTTTDEAERARLFSVLMAFDERVLFEYERDLVELHRSEEPSERLSLLLKVRTYRFSEGRDCEFTSVVDRHLPEEYRDRLGGHLLALQLRSAPTAEACREFQRILRGE